METYTEFLSTLSLRRATLVSVATAELKGDFYPRSPCGERQESTVEEAPNNEISIHALLAESDHVNGGVLSNSSIISIHALLAESDPFFFCP